ncbi:beta-ketoacyl synthase N-terminal-like domain-containing protein [Paenibacillus sp. M.A.Huq-81]
MTNNKINPTDIAIIGAAGYFPGNGDIREYWSNISGGVECIKFFTDEELLQRGVDPSILDNPNFVKAGGFLENADKFDAEFFGYSPREAEVMDPQQRIFLECAWNALEDAGYSVDNKPQRVGVFAGCTMNTYLLNNLMTRRNVLEFIGDQQTMIGNDKDYLVSRVSYKMDLKGPSVNVQAACASSLLAVHVASQSLLSGECDLAIAGGSSVRVPDTGYMFALGGTSSPDGHCRAFDEKAAGSVPGSGSGAIILKRLSEAIEDKDHIYAVVKGSAINNDGSGKAGFTAPSVDGQVRAITEALNVSAVSPDTITYVEAHGTGTTIGDPIEVNALSTAFLKLTSKTRYCALGSVKTNIGHLDAAAGIAGLMKVILSLKNKKIAPSLHYTSPNPRIDFNNSPFFVNTKLTDWEPENMPRRAGISSVGMGGVNVFVVLEEAPEPAPQQEHPARPFHLLPLSAKTADSLDRAAKKLAHTLKDNPEYALSDVEYTLQTGRKAFNRKMVVISKDAGQAIDQLESATTINVFKGNETVRNRPIVFLFPGQGAQYINMGKDLYENEPLYKQIFDECSEYLLPIIGKDLREILFLDGEGAAAESKIIHQTQYTQPLLFTTEYALAKLWMSWGIAPASFIGHSIGEFVAAALAGVFEWKDALKIVAKRGELISELTPGLMLSVNVSKEKIIPILPRDCSIAAINGPAHLVVSGPKESVRDFEDSLTEQGIAYQRLFTSHAFHSQMMDPIVEPLKAELAQLQLSKPSIPFISCVTGTWIEDQEAASPDYWARHLRQTVFFQDGISELLKEKDALFLECGPNQVLSSLTRLNVPVGTEITILQSMRHPNQTRNDLEVLLETAGRLWISGASIDWSRMEHHASSRRVSLPGYQFNRKRYWVEQEKELVQQPVAAAPKVVQPVVEVQVAAPKKEEPKFVQPKTELYERPALNNEYVSLSGETEKQLAQMWSSLTGIKNIGATDNFFELGGHSLMATQLITQIRENFRVELEMTQLFNAPTISAIAKAINELQMQDQEFQDLISKVDGLSDEEVEAMLSEKI